MPTPEKWSLPFKLTNYSFVGDLEGGLLYWRTQRWASASVGAPLLGNMDGRFFLGAFLLEEFLLGLLRDMQNAL